MQPMLMYGEKFQNICDADDKIKWQARPAFRRSHFDLRLLSSGIDHCFGISTPITSIFSFVGHFDFFDFSMRALISISPLMPLFRAFAAHEHY